LRFLAKLEESSKAGYVMGGIDKRETKVECLDELEVCVAKLKHVYLSHYCDMRSWNSGREEYTHLEQIGKVDKHIVTCLFLPASDIKTDSDNVETLTALGKFMFHRESVKPSGG